MTTAGRSSRSDRRRCRDRMPPATPTTPRRRPTTRSPATTRHRRSRSIRPSGSSIRPTRSPINFTVMFSESVTGFATGDVTIAGSSGGNQGRHGHRVGHDVQRGRHGHDDLGHGHGDDRGRCRHRCGRQRQHGLDLDRQRGDLRRRPAVRHDRPGGGAARPDRYQPRSTSRWRSARSPSRLHDRRRDPDRHRRRDQDRHGHGLRHDVQRRRHRHDEPGHRRRVHRCRRRDRYRGQRKPRLDLDGQHGHLGQRPARRSRSTRRPARPTRPTRARSTSRSCSASPSRASRRAT